MQPDVESEPIYFNSLYRHGVDEKRRVQIPAKWRAPQPEVLTLILWPKGSTTEACLLVLPPKLWRSLADQLTGMSYSDPKAEALRALVGRRSDRVTLDKGGRICLPEWMTRAAGIKNEAVLAGMVDRYEIWDPERFESASVLNEQLLREAFQLI